MLCKWIRIMVSFPRSSQATVLARFHEISGLVVYAVFGLIMLCIPVLLHYILQVNFEGRAVGYLRMAGIELTIVGFNYFVIGRTKPRAVGAGYILASVPERLVLVNVLFLVLLLQKLLPLSLALGIIIVDSILAIATFLIWYKTTDGASFTVFFKDIFRPLLVRCLFDRRRGASVAVGSFGMLQFLIGFIFAVKPEITREVFSLDPFKDHAAGFLGAFFALLCESAWQQIFMGKAGSVAFNIAAAFTRLFFKIPSLVILLATKQIEVHLGVFLVVLDSAFSVIILLLLFLSGVEDDEGPDETDAIIPKESGDNTSQPPDKTD